MRHWYVPLLQNSIAAIEEIHQKNQCDHFLMKLRLEFEMARVTLMNRTLTLSLHTFLSGLPRDEQWLRSQASISQQHVTL